MKNLTVIIPSNYTWLHVSFDEVVRLLVDKTVVKEPSLKRQGDWYVEYFDNAALHLRAALLRGIITAFYYEDDGIKEVPYGLWRKEDSDQWIRRGEISLDGDRSEILFVKTDDFNSQILNKLKERNSLELISIPSGDGADIAYTTPFIDLMLEAIKHFDIPNKLPTVAVLSDYFIRKKLPDGRPITGNLAKYMATFCRPSGAMIGGKRRAQN